jgi:hypothetical protein
MKNLSARLPTRQEATPVFSVVVFIIFSWTLYRMFWYVPSWLEYLSIWSVVITAAYILSFALLESCIIFGLLCLFLMVFPTRIIKEQFIAQSCSIVTGLSVAAFLLQRKMKLIYRLTYLQLLAYPVFFLFTIIILILVLAFVFRHFEFLARFVRGVAERMTIFLYVYVPLGCLGLLTVLFRSIF